MTKLNFQIKSEKETKTEGLFSLEPLESGFGHTLGNSLRRVLLTALPGAAVTYVKISGVRHQFSTLAGLKEDVVEFILNVKKINIKADIEKAAKMTLDVIGPGEVKTGDIDTPAGVEVINKDLVLGHLADKKSKLSCEMTIERGVGYSPFEERKSETLGIIPVDAIFSPVIKVNHKVETTRLGDRLIIEIVTDGTVSPKDALKHSAKILVDSFMQIVEPKAVAPQKKEDSTLSSDALKLTIEELSLPTRIINALEKSGYKIVGDLVTAMTTDRKKLASVKNLGEKSMKIIDVALKEKGVSLL